MSRVKAEFVLVECDVCKIQIDPNEERTLHEWLWVDAVDICPKCSTRVLKYLLESKNVSVEAVKEIINDIEIFKK